MSKSRYAIAILMLMVPHLVYSQILRSISSNDTLLRLQLSPDIDTIHISDTLEVKVEFINAGANDIHILNRLWLHSKENLVLRVTDESGKELLSPNKKSEQYKIHGVEVAHLDFAAPPSPEPLLLKPSEFWGITLFWGAKRFPKPGIYYIEATYYGSPSKLIKELMKKGIVKSSDLKLPLEKFWQGRAESNKVKIVVKK